MRRFEEDGVVISAYGFVEGGEFRGCEFGRGGVADGFNLGFWLASADDFIESVDAVEMTSHTISFPIPVNNSRINSVGALSGLKR